MSKKKPPSLEASRQEELLLMQGCLLGDVTKITESQFNALQNFMEFCIGNAELNAILKQDFNNSLNLAQNFKDSLSYFTYKTRNIDIDKAEKDIEKLSRAYEAISQGKPVSKEDKLSLKEFAVIHDLAGATGFLNELNTKGLLQGNKKLEQFHKNANKAKEMVYNLNAQVQKELGALGPGVIVLENREKSYTVKRKSFSTLLERISNILTKHSHAAVAHAPEEFQGKAVRSEIFQQTNLQNYNIKISEHLESDTYKINVSALIPASKHELMRETYGDDWQAKIATKYKLIENNIHGTEAQQRFGNLQASGYDDQVRAGLAEITPFGHKQVKANNFDEIHGKVMGNHYASQKDPKMLCSEFAAVTLIGALVELDKQIKKDVNHQRRAEGFAPIPTKEKIVTIPIGKHEDLHKLHPSRLLKVLQGYKCVEPVAIKSSEYIVEPVAKSSGYMAKARQALKSVKKHFVQVEGSKAAKKRPNIHGSSAKKQPKQKER